MILHVVCVAYQRAIPLRVLVDSFINQTNPNWKLYVVHDGPANADVKTVMSLYKADNRISFTETTKRQKKFGHPIRREMVQKVTIQKGEYLVITNDDNYYVPTFVAKFLLMGKPNVGMVYCDTLHHCMEYRVLHTRLKVNYIDMGSFAVRGDVAKLVGFNHDRIDADGIYAEECARYCQSHLLNTVYIDLPLFIHN